MRTKPTMYKRMLRSALAVVFSAVAVFGAAVAVSEDAGNAGQVARAASGPAGKPDLGWDVAPSTRTGALGTDLGWDTIPAKAA
ncbi:hypothetical protein AB0F18_05690 [Streptomyces sp. NPDC029216]|uniref:hypothetical protein n=1 Tax=Streptomyces sp. NPDC029216 TaxID=3154701 RepID=UPI0033FC09F1